MQQQSMFRLWPVLALSAGLMATGCGGGGGGGGDGSGTGGTSTGVANAVADAGEDQLITRGFMATLDGSASSDPDNDSLTYTWTQVSGPDVTGGSGMFTGAMPSFVSPGEVTSLEFDLTVNDGNGDSPADRVLVNVLEDTNQALFVDADNGDDATGDGSMDNPFATIAAAIDAVAGNGEDIYVATPGGGVAYDETVQTLTVPTGTSLYGGYGAGWVRDPAVNRTPLDGANTAIRFSSVDMDAWLSGFEITAAGSADAGTSVSGVWAVGGNATLVIENNTVTAGDVGPGTATTPGSSYGVYVANLEATVVRENMIVAGLGGAGDNGNDGDRGSEGANGANASGNGRASGGSGSPGLNGGSGGERGGGPGGNGGAGAPGGSGGACTGGSGGRGGSGNGDTLPAGGGTGGTGGVGNAGTGGSGSGGLFSSFSPRRGGYGSTGGAGCGGGGGGGGEANLFGTVGGGGGGGGEGGAGGSGGQGGAGGGASVGLWLYAINTQPVIESNTILSGNGGDGAMSGRGGAGGSGGAGGQGADGDSNISGNGGDGANGGWGGYGGRGGKGGGGGGGPSYGIVVGQGLAPLITDNTVSSGMGGDGGAANASDSNDGNGGEGGWSYAIFDANTSDGLVPALVGNDLIPGLGGGGGTATGSGGAGSDGQAGATNW